MVAVAYHASHFETSVASFVYISKESWLRQNTELNLYSELWIALALAAPSCGLKKSWINTMLALSSDGLENACMHKWYQPTIASSSSLPTKTMDLLKEDQSLLKIKCGGYPLFVVLSLCTLCNVASSAIISSAFQY